MPMYGRIHANTHFEARGGIPTVPPFETHHHGTFYDFPAFRPQTSQHRGTASGLRVSVYRWEVVAGGDQRVLDKIRCSARVNTATGKMVEGGDKEDGYGYGYGGGGAAIETKVCDRSLLGEATSTKGTYQTTQGTVKTVWHMERRPEIAVEWVYGTCACGHTTHALDGALLARLPDRLIKQYGVRPEYNLTEGGQRLARDITDSLKYDLEKDVAAQSAVRKIKTSLFAIYVEHQNDYLSHIEAFRGAFTASRHTPSRRSTASTTTVRTTSRLLSHNTTPHHL